MARDYKWLPLDLVEDFEPLAESLDVSTVARSSRGFLPQFKKAGGDPDELTDYWRRKRNGFVARHMAQVRNNDEALWDKDGIPSRRHLALIMWAYSPQEARLDRFLDEAAAALEGLGGIPELPTYKGGDKPIPKRAFEEGKDALRRFFVGEEPIASYTHGEYTVHVIPPSDDVFENPQYYVLPWFGHYIIVKEGDPRPVPTGRWMRFWDRDIEEVLNISEEQYNAAPIEQRALMDAAVQAIKYVPEQFERNQKQFWSGGIWEKRTLR
jgi:hypothetical protein